MLIPSYVFTKGLSNFKNALPSIVLEVIFFTKINEVLKQTPSLQIWAFDILYSIFNLLSLA